jgi:hypothetical protein
MFRCARFSRVRALAALALGLLLVPLGASPRAEDQLVVVLDASGSMAEAAPYPEAAGRSRWRMALDGLRSWQQSRQFDGFSVGTIAVTDRGDCLIPAAGIHLPGAIGGTLDRWAEGFTPNGGTPLNAALEELPRIFTNTEGKRRVLIISDGLNSCPPRRSTCDIVRELNRTHGMTFDVLAFIAEPGMEAEFRCVAEASGGTFRAPTQASEWGELPLGFFDPWPYVVMALSLISLLLTAEMGYAHLANTVRWPPQQAALSTSAACFAAGLVVWGVMFLGQGWIAAVIGAVAAVATVSALTRTKAPSQVAVGRRPEPW